MTNSYPHGSSSIRAGSTRNSFAVDVNDDRIQLSPLRLIFLGPPGAGKGTQARSLAQAFGIVHIAIGEILRSAVKQKTKLGQIAQSYIDQGQLVPDPLILELIQSCFAEMDTDSGWILDGFPRTIVQAAYLDILLEQIRQSLDWVVNFEVPDEVLLLRLSNRGRSDDQEAVIRQRLKIYRSQTAPLIEFYRDRHQLICINGAQLIEAVTAELQQLLRSSRPFAYSDAVSD